MLLDTLVNLALNIKDAVYLCTNNGDFLEVKHKNQQFEKAQLDSIRHPLERLSNNILYALNLPVVQNIIQTRQGAFPKKESLSILNTTDKYNGVAAKTDKPKMNENGFLKSHRKAQFGTDNCQATQKNK